MNGDSRLLEIRDLHIGFRKDDVVNDVVHGISLDLSPGETLALVGESGSGKTVTAQSILRLYPESLVAYTGGSIRFDGTSVFEASNEELRALRGNRAGMIFRNPSHPSIPFMTSGNSSTNPSTSIRD